MQLFSTMSACLLLAGSALAQNTVKVHVVTVSSSSSSVLKFSPNNVQAAPGEMVQFQFRTGNHSVVQSTFAKPCVPINNVMSNVTGFFSGFQPVQQGATSIPTYTIMVNNTNPIWYYCAQAKHCEAGMVGAINAATSGQKTIDAFTKLAASAPDNIAPGSSNSTSSSSSSSTSYSGSAATSTSMTTMSTATSSTTSTAASSSASTANGAEGSFFAGSKQALTGVSVAALLSALLL